MGNYAKSLHKIFKQRGDSNKYPKYIFCGEIAIKQGFSYILFCPLRTLYNSKFVIMATFLGQMLSL